MKRAWLTVIAAVVVLTAGAAALQAEAFQLTGNIPFEFVVGTEKMPAGEYTFRTADRFPGLWVLTGPDSVSGSFVCPMPGVAKNVKAKPRLVFQKQGDDWVLTQMWTNASDRVLEFRKAPAQANQNAKRGRTQDIMTVK